MASGRYAAQSSQSKSPRPDLSPTAVATSSPRMAKPYGERTAIRVQIFDIAPLEEQNNSTVLSHETALVGIVGAAQQSTLPLSPPLAKTSPRQASSFEKKSTIARHSSEGSCENPRQRRVSIG